MPMPPFRQPTPSPPPPVESDSRMPPASSSIPPPMSSRADDDGDGGEEVSVPPNFVPPPPPREVATGVSNLGNTCYMNAAIQALAHAPELCHALDAESHLKRCPVALRNERRRRKRLREEQEGGTKPGNDDVDGEAKSEASAGTTGGAYNFRGAGKSGSSHHRRSSSSSSNGSSSKGAATGTGRKRGRQAGHQGSGAAAARLLDWDPEYEYCTLCELERLLGRVHSRPVEEVVDPEEEEEEGGGKGGDASAARCGDPSSSSFANPNEASLTTTTNGGPVVPETFVSGFMSKVAPWFRRGVQEDSHEFLRLLIDAMQNSCKGARKSAQDDDGTVAAGRGGGKQRTSPRNNVGRASSSSSSSSEPTDADQEYPFRLFRGTVESNVTCSACRATSRKIDPIEDIGLDILPLRGSPPHRPPNNNGGDRYSSSMSSSRSTSPTSNVALADVQQALERFISSERLDSGYKCEKCGKLGKATKTSRLASIPPILTLHLKRFRYGAAGGGAGMGSKRGGGQSVNYSESGYGGGGGGGGGSTRSGRAARGGGGGYGALPDFDNVGPSGSAKVEGHVRFSPVLDVKPYLTQELQQTVFQRALCRLFAVVVHTGKNSHSGHYVAYVQSVKGKGWFKMDDAKIVPVNQAEVLNAEAYMLFYRVTSHPVATRLKEIADAKEERGRRIVDEIRRREEAARAAEETKRANAEKAAKAAVAALQDLVDKTEDGGKLPPDPTPSMSDDGEEDDPAAISPPVPLGKRARPALASGEEWMKAATNLPPEYLPLFHRIQEFVAENVTFSPEFFRYITEEYNRMSSKMSIGRRVKNNKRIKTLLGKGPGGVYPPEDVQGGAEDIQGGILDIFHQISIMVKKNSGTGNANFLLPKIEEDNEDDKKEAPATAGLAETTLAVTAPSSPVPALTIDNELVIPDEGSPDCYDGAL